MPALQLSSSYPFENLMSAEETSLENAESEKDVENEEFVAEPEGIYEATSYVWHGIEDQFMKIGAEDTEASEG
ncbi:hypothetical protein NDU88_007962 [Pleurodeles waltl]|uniref:Uncharacterized protein n=1 Tax=Pleurodeles waltl TaxID=8319 RepID=A0AAV7N7T2_PLEWA|nr:hypothetical protein NDU88_007962 [Pleurodeles waltl]